MLPREYHLSLRNEFGRIKKSGRHLSGELVTTLYSPSSTPRFAFIVSNKISNKSSKRNRIKRLLCEAMRGLIGEIKKPHDFIIIANPKILGKNLVEIKKELEKLIAKISNSKY